MRTARRWFYAPRPRGLKRWCCLTSVRLTSVAYIRSAGGVCGRPAGWRVLADRARLVRPGSMLPLRASVAGLGGGISWRPPAYSLLQVALVCIGGYYLLFPFSALTLLVGRQEGHPASKKLAVGLLMVTIWLELCTTYSCSCHTPHPSLAPIKFQNGDIPVLANPGPPGKLPLKRRERERERERESTYLLEVC